MSLASRYREVRDYTEHLSSYLSAEDQTVQSMPDCSPTKWHRAHTTWFFETVVLTQLVPTYQPFNPLFIELFNSYYEAVGPQFPRAARGVISRPGIQEIADYRAHVDQAMVELLSDSSFADYAIVELGLQHEQQHQELLLMDIKHAMSLNPLRPVTFPMNFEPGSIHSSHPNQSQPWLPFFAGLVDIGATEAGFAFDNEQPRHATYLQDFEIASTLVTNEEWLAFMDAGGYQRSEFWLSEGWNFVQQHGINAPLYWLERDGNWLQFTLAGVAPLDLKAPVTHISYYEADAYASYAGARLPTEAEWEHTAASMPQDFQQAYDSGWQWTGSAYLPYPGFTPLNGTVREYNGKFMASQMVLRGGSALTPEGHARATYRNFFYPHARWMQSSVRLAR